MGTISNIALSGMNAAVRRIGAAGQNVAVTPVIGAKRQIVSEETLASGGVATSVTIAEAPAAAPTAMPAAAPADDDLARDLIDMHSATYDFKANLRMVEAEHEMLGTLLDERA